MRHRGLRRAFMAVVTTTILSSCVQIQKAKIEEIPPGDPGVERVRSPVRAFLADGSVVLYPDGFRLDGDTIRTAGTRYDLHRTGTAPQETLALDSVVGLEAFTTVNDPGGTLLASAALTALVIGGGVAIACAADPKCFGSCPTVYTMDESGEILEAEAFSYSISPLLEGRDLDPLGTTADAQGRVELEIRNEALETHYINHLALVEVRHGPDERAVTDDRGRAAVVGPLEALTDVRDRAGRDVSELVARRDERVYSTDPARVAAVESGDFLDWVEIRLPPADADTVALTLRLRNSLLNTVLFYDFMLAAQGAGALDWLGRDVQRIGTAVELGSWYRKTLGLRVQVDRAGGFDEIARIPDTGPIAWKEVAVRIPVRRGQPTRVRLSFLADAWRIDRIALAREVRVADTRTLAATVLGPSGGPDDPELRGRVAEPDDSYLVTSAGTHFRIRFDAGTVPAGIERTFLLSSQGYYTEWVRPDWIRSAAAPRPFRPSDRLVVDLMERWLEVKEGFEESFHATRIPVR